MLCALQVEEAGHVFLLMKKDYRISRNVRLAWVLSRLHQVIWAVPEPELQAMASAFARIRTRARELEASSPPPKAPRNRKKPAVP